jgi:hypothetical protein
MAPGVVSVFRREIVQQRDSIVAGFLSRIISNALTSAPESPFRKRRSAHFSSDPQALADHHRSFRHRDHLNLYLALQAYIEESAAPPNSIEWVGAPSSLV